MSFSVVKTRITENDLPCKLLVQIGHLENEHIIWKAPKQRHATWSNRCNQDDEPGIDLNRIYSYYGYAGFDPKTGIYSRYNFYQGSKYFMRIIKLYNSSESTI